MALSFNEGYRAISLAYVAYGRPEEREQFASNVYSYLSSFNIDSYVGICFGKYSRVVDFSHRSAKIASFHLGKIQQKMEEDGIQCSFSTVLCKPFKTTIVHSKEKLSVYAYTFLKPIGDSFNYSGVLSLCKEICEGNLNIDIEAYWNNSLYPLIIITRGRNYQDTVESIVRLRKQSETAVDSSSYITLRVDSRTHEPVQDEVNGKVFAIFFSKLAALSKIDVTQTRLPSAQSVLPNPVQSLGWYDVCDYLSFNNLYELYQYGQKLKNESRGNITFTSTLLLGGKTS
jgi:hypothetical protein